MGVAIEYFSKQDVANEDVKAIVAASREPNEQPWLLCEPIHFFDAPGYEDRLYGASKLNLMPDADEKLEAEANYQAEKNDLEFLLDKLAEISQRHQVDWTIQLEGEVIGAIEKGVCDPAVRDAVQAMADVAQMADQLGDLGDFDEFT